MLLTKAVTVRWARAAVNRRRRGLRPRRQTSNSSSTTSPAPTRDEGVGKVEDRERPHRRVEQDVVDHMAIDGAVDQVADRAADDQRKADAGENLPRDRYAQASKSTKAMTASDTAIRPLSPIQLNIEKATPVL